MKIVYMGTPAFALPTLRALCQSGHQVVGVVTQPDRPRGRGRALQAPPVKQFAVSAGIEVFQPPSAGAPEFVETLHTLAPDKIIVAAFGQILKPAIVDHWFCLNLHASLLPRYRGAAPINRAIVNGDSETGITTMKIAAGLDTGDILLKRTVTIGKSDDAQTLHDTLAEEGASLVLETLSQLEDQSLTPTPQDHSQATYASKLTKEDGHIFWDKGAEEIRNLVRGLVPWPGAFTFFKSRRLRIVRAETAPGTPEDRAGVIARVADHGIEVGTAVDRLVITELQPEGKKIMCAQAFLQGHAIKKGDRFDRAAETTNAA